VFTLPKPIMPKVNCFPKSKNSGLRCNKAVMTYSATACALHPAAFDHAI
jgi:hypothetical protein